MLQRNAAEGQTAHTHAGDAVGGVIPIHSTGQGELQTILAVCICRYHAHQQRGGGCTVQRDGRRPHSPAVRLAPEHGFLPGVRRWLLHVGWGAGCLCSLHG